MLINFFKAPQKKHLAKATMETLEKRVRYVCSKLTIKTPERRHCVFIVNISHLLVFLLLTLSMYLFVGIVFIISLYV